MNLLDAARAVRPRRSLRRQFEDNEGRLIDKWIHYFDIYERHFSPYRRTRPRILEIGISHGGSLDLWRDYFGRGVEIVGIDIDRRALALAEPGIDICIGDQGNPEFLRQVARDHGPFDIVIDDGSHRSEHQLCSLEHLWPALRPGGIYLVEDLHTNYWQDYGGGLGRDGTFMEFVKGLLDHLNAFHSNDPSFTVSEWTRTLGGVHVYDSIVVLDRLDRSPPESKMTGRPVFRQLYNADFDDRLDDEHRARIEEMNRPARRLRRIVGSPIRSFRRARTRRNLPDELADELV
jgi:SAM-dependent methyltransferase